MSDWDTSRGDVYARGHAMAHDAILASLLRAMISKKLLTPAETNTMLSDLMGMFRQPMATDHQMVAAATIFGILQNVLPPKPEALPGTLP